MSFEFHFFLFFGPHEISSSSHTVCTIRLDAIIGSPLLYSIIEEACLCRLATPFTLLPIWDNLESMRLRTGHRPQTPYIHFSQDHALALTCCCLSSNVTDSSSLSSLVLPISAATSPRPCLQESKSLIFFCVEEEVSPSPVQHDSRN